MYQFKYVFIQLGLVSLALTAMTGCGTQGDSEPLVNGVQLESEIYNGSLISELTLNGGNVRIRPGETTQLQAMGLDISGNLTDVTERLTWTSNEPEYASIDQKGQVTGLTEKNIDQGFVTFSAESINGITATIQVSISEIPATGLVISPPDTLNGEVYTCVDTRFSARITYQDDFSHSVSDRVDWQVAGSETAYFDSEGLLHTNNPGEEQLSIQAEIYGVSASLDLTTNNQINTIYLYLNDEQTNLISLASGNRVQPKAIASFNAGLGITTQEISKNTLWTTSHSAIFGVTNTPDHIGTLLVIKPGDALLTLGCGGKQAFASIKVSGNSQLESFKINDGSNNFTLAKGNTLKLKAYVQYKDQNEAFNISEFVDWQIENNSMLTGSLTGQGTLEASYQIQANNLIGGETLVTVNFDGNSKPLTIKITD